MKLFLLFILPLISATGMSAGKIPPTPADFTSQDGTRCWVHNKNKPAIIKSNLQHLTGSICMYVADCADAGKKETYGESSVSKLTATGCKTFEQSLAESETEMGFLVHRGRELTDPDRSKPAAWRDYSANEYRTKDNRFCRYQNETFPILVLRRHPQNPNLEIGFCFAQATCRDVHGRSTTEYPRSEYIPTEGCRPLDQALETENQAGLALAFDDKSNVKVSKAGNGSAQPNSVPHKSVQVTAPAPKTASNHKSQPSAVRGFNTSPRPRK